MMGICSPTFPNEHWKESWKKVVGYECFCCEKAGKDARRCQLRRDIEATYHYDYPDDGKECPFAGMTIGGSCEKVEEDADDSEKE